MTAPSPASVAVPQLSLCLSLSPLSTQPSPAPCTQLDACPMQRNERGVEVLAPYVVLVQWQQQQWAAKSKTKSAAEVIKHHQFNQHCRRPTWAIQEGRGGPIWTKSNCPVNLVTSGRGAEQCWAGGWLTSN